MDNIEVIMIIVALLGLTVGGFFSMKWKQACELLKELGEAFTRTSEALEDKKLTREEAVGLLKEWQDVFTKVMLMLGR